jgi:hypothetical protein
VGIETGLARSPVILVAAQAGQAHDEDPRVPGRLAG